MIVEVVAYSVNDCVNCQRVGVGRVELTSGIELGGLTPGIGLVKQVQAACSLPLMVMIRPRSGGFFYSDAEFECMMAEITTMRELKPGGFVFGVLEQDGGIDIARMRRLAEACGDQDRVCHKAFDVTPDPFLALDQLADAGITRVITSGQKPCARDSMDLLNKLSNHSAGKIEVMPAGDVRASDIATIRTQIEPKSVHLGPFSMITDPTSALSDEISYGPHPVVDMEVVREVLDEVCRV